MMDTMTARSLFLLAALLTAVAACLPLFVGVGHSFLMSQICIYGVIALSLTFFSNNYANGFLYQSSASLTLA